MNHEPIRSFDRDRPDLVAARRWFTLALAVLICAGVFALAVVIGRMPPFDRYVTDPLFFKRCLVAHVNLALVAWFYSFVVALLFLLPSRRPCGPLARRSAPIGAAGVALMLIGAAHADGAPMLSNYIPTIDNLLFPLGQLVFGFGVLAAILDLRLLPGGEHEDGPVAIPEASRVGLRATAAALLLAAVTFLTTWLVRMPGLPADVAHDFLVWGLGHVLQLVSTAALVTVWMLLLAPVLGGPPVSRRAAGPLFLALLLPWTIAPIFALQGADSLAYRHGFTQLMRWCLFPVESVFLVLCLSAVARAWRSGRIGAATFRDSRFSAFLVSVALTVLGFGLGAAIRGSNTMVPAHYHAAVGAVTVAFMAAAYVLLPAFGIAVPRGWAARAATWQSALYGLGMFVFAAGFATAGARGMGRKLYGAEQSARGFAESVGLGLMGIGGLVAIAGGVLFLVIVSAALTSANRTGRAVATIETSGRLPHEAR